MRRNFLKNAALFGLLASTAPLTALADGGDFPNKPIRIIVPATAGGSSDLFVRAIALRMQESLKQPVIIEYKPGAGTNIGNSYVAKSAPDGYTLLINGIPLAVNSLLYPNLNYNPSKDLLPLIEIAAMSNVVTVHPSVPAKSLKELVELMKRQKDSFNYGTTGAGSSGHLSGQLLAMKTGTKLTHVAYQGNAQANTDHLGGFLQVGFVNLPVAIQFVNTGKLRALAVTGDKRSALMPDVPTVAEALGIPDYKLSGWFGILAPAGTPQAIRKKLHAEFETALKHPSVRSVINNGGSEVSGGSIEAFEQLLKNDTQRLKEVIQYAGIKND